MVMCACNVVCALCVVASGVLYVSVGVCVGAGVSVRCVVCGVWCLCVCVCVRGVCCVCGAAWHAEKPPVCRFKNVPVCRFKTPPCEPAERPHVEHMRAFCRYTQRPFKPTHGDVLILHTGGLSLSSPSLFLSSFSSFSLPSFSSLFSLLSSLFSPLPVTMTMITRSVGSLCKQSSDLTQCQCAWTSVHSLLAEHVRIMQETTVLA